VTSDLEKSCNGATARAELDAKMLEKWTKVWEGGCRQRAGDRPNKRITSTLRGAK